MIARCKCGREFEARGDWQKLCWECWRDRERQRAGRGDLSVLMRQSAKAVETAYEAGRERGYEEGYEKGRATSVTGDEAISPGLLRELVRLCHPDLHPPERFQLANRVTAQLMSMRTNGRA